MGQGRGTNSLRDRTSRGPNTSVPAPLCSLTTCGAELVSTGAWIRVAALRGHPVGLVNHPGKRSTAKDDEKVIKVDFTLRKGTSVRVAA